MKMSPLSAGLSKRRGLHRNVFILFFCSAWLGTSLSAQEVSWNPSNYNEGDTISLVLDDWIEASISEYTHSFSPPFVVDSGSVIGLDQELSYLSSGALLIGSATWDSQSKQISLSLRREDGNPMVEDSLHAVFKGIIVTVEDIVFRQASAGVRTALVTLFPQHVDTYSDLQIPSDMKVRSIRLLDHQGHVIQKYSHTLRRLPLAGLSSGCYLVLIETQDVIYPLRLIKQ